MTSQDDASDAALLESIANGGASEAAAAARALMGRHLGRVLGIAHRLLGDKAEAEDVAQETMLRAWKIASDWRDEGAPFASWLRRVAQNLCYDRLRKKNAAPLADTSEPQDPTPAASVVMARKQRAVLVHYAVAQLPKRQCDAIRLRHFEGLGNPEIAARLNVSVEAVESLLSRGRRALRQALADQREYLE